MASSDIDLYSLQGIKGQGLSEQERAVLDILGLAMRTPTSPEAMVDAARQLDAKCPPLEEEIEFNTYVSDVWIMVVSIASSYDVSDEVQGYLIDILKALEQQPKNLLRINIVEGDCRDYKPQIAMHIYWDFEDPTYILPEENGILPGDLVGWRKLNSFYARLTEAKIFEPSYQVMEAMNRALEEDISALNHPGLEECRVQIACEWMERCAGQMLLWALENHGNNKDGSVIRSAWQYENGALYKGPSAMCLQRWGFWIQRFQVLGKKDSGLPEETRKAALEAARYMKTVEGSAGHTSASGASEELSEEPSQVPLKEPSDKPKTGTSGKPVEGTLNEPKAKGEV
ncbi:hypothetical protein PG991_010937 [Apiospora marii]|uniref:Uncharacterized protein n=1 Tax=Apiospora marii TaxID=335849 RepID=A0ABR1RES9_9PEZI